MARRRWIAAAILSVTAVTRAGAAPSRADRIWFAPAPGSLDYVRLFQAPGEWPSALRVVDVFKFYQQHTEPGSNPIVGPNTFEALQQAGAFRILSRTWGKKIAIEVGAVKEFYCTPDARGMQSAIDATAASVAAVVRGGGVVSYLAMDEPFLAGRSVRCGGPSLVPTADRLAVHMKATRKAFPWIRTGLIEAYPSFSAGAFADMLGLMRERGVPPAFLHVDVDLRALRDGRDDFSRDMRALSALARAQGIPFGLIVWGENGNADALYAADAMRLEQAIEQAFPTWNVMPPQLVVQSWAESAGGLRITPSNLPETRPDTHTDLLMRIFLRLFATRGRSGAQAR